MIVSWLHLESLPLDVAAARYTVRKPQALEVVIFKEEQVYF